MYRYVCVCKILNKKDLTKKGYLRKYLKEEVEVRHVDI